MRVNIEADSINSAVLLPQAGPDTAAFDLLVKEVVREMTVKSGQKCTAIRRVFVPEALYGQAAEAIGARLAKVTVGNPRNDAVRMGAADGGDSAVARRVGERLLSAGDDDGRGQRTAPRRALSVALIVLASVLFLAFVLLMAQYLMGRSLTGPSRATALPPPSPPATSIAPVAARSCRPAASRPARR